jgi:hypothetical protein
LPHRELKNCLSFANIKNNKTQPELQQTPRNTAAKTPALHTRRKQKENLWQIQHPVDPLNSNLMFQTYKIQNESLKETVVVLKDQVRVLQAN